MNRRVRGRVGGGGSGGCSEILLIVLGLPISLVFFEQRQVRTFAARMRSARDEILNICQSLQLVADVPEVNDFDLRLRYIDAGLVAAVVEFDLNEIMISC